MEVEMQEEVDGVKSARLIHEGLVMYVAAINPLDLDSAINCMKIKMLHGQRTGIASFGIGDFAINAEGKRKRITAIDRIYHLLKFGAEGEWTSCEGWRAEWTVPDAERVTKDAFPRASRPESP